MKARHPLGLRIIGIIKVIESILLAAVGFGIFHIMGTDLGITIDHIIRKLHLSPGNRFIETATAHIAGISQEQLRAIDAGTFFYAILYIIEGTGLILAQHWAEYLTIGATASLLPLEIYEIHRKISATKVGVLLINLAILVYLIYQLKKERQEIIQADGREGIS